VKLLLLPLAGAATLTAATAVGSFTYSEARGDGYPRHQAELYAQRDREDLPAMRRHGWDIWAAITVSNGSGMPAFLTWYQPDELFAEEEPPAARHFRPSFNHPKKKTLGLGDAILSFNTYNRPLLQHVRNLGLHKRANLKAMVGVTPKVENFPRTAIMVKTVWWPVRGDAPSAFPVWDEEPTRPVEWGRGIAEKVKRGSYADRTPAAQALLASHELHGNDFETFRRVVALCPSGQSTGKSEVTFYDPEDLNLQRRARRVGRNVPLSSLFSFKLQDPAMIADLQRLPDLEDITTKHWGRPLQLGDSLALVAAHVSTRETDDWVWTTYWWHDEPDQGTGSDRSSNVRGVWRNYKMRVTYSAERPREADGTPPIVYNPYLEAGFSDGPRSNCVSCHQRAVVLPSGGMGPVFPVPTGRLPDADPFFRDKLQLDFVWSLATRSR
jgi:hypothetical protein